LRRAGRAWLREGTVAAQPVRGSVHPWEFLSAMHKNARCIHTWQSVHGHTAGCLRAFEPATRKAFTHKKSFAGAVVLLNARGRARSCSKGGRARSSPRLQSAQTLVDSVARYDPNQGRARTGGVEPLVASCAQVRGVSRGSQARSTSSEARNVTRGRQGRLSGEAGSPSCHNTPLGDRPQHKQKEAGIGLFRFPQKRGASKRASSTSTVCSRACSPPTAAAL
jgi:hypothetical protein